MKPIEQRISECVSIRTQLQAYGIFSIPNVATKMTSHMNEFIKDGVSQTFTLKTEGGISFRVFLTCKEGKQSGVEMIR